MFAHAFTQCAFCVTYVLFTADFAGNAVYDVICFARTAPDGVVAAPSDRAGDTA